MRFALLSIVSGAGLVLAASGSAAAFQGEPSRPPGAASVAVYVSEAARRFAIPERWIYLVIRIESAGYPRAVSPKGAIGLMQIMPATWADLRARYALGDDPFEPRNNIMAGAAYLREMYDRYGAPGFLAAYNSGPGRYESYLAGRQKLPRETLAYVARLAPSLDDNASRRSIPAGPNPVAWRAAALFTSRVSDPADDGSAADAPAPADAAAARPAGAGDAAATSENSLFIPPTGQAQR